MMNRQIGNLGKRLVLLAAMTLSGLVILEATQQGVRAIDLHVNADSIPADHTPANSAETAQGSNFFTVHSAVSPQTPASTQPKTGQLKTGKGAIAQPINFNVSVSHPKTSVLSAGAAHDPQQPLSQISPSQVATSVNAWNGASFPVEGFQAYTSPFGYRQSATGGYSQEFHYGLDMAAPEGSYVRNWWSGKVVEVSDDSNCGTSVVVESGNWTHIYCHMEGHVETDGHGRSMIDRDGGIQIYEGQQVEAGARIGRVGMTGRTTGPHLHWGLKYDGNWVDPAYVLRAMYSGQEAAAQATGDRVQ